MKIYFSKPLIDIVALFAGWIAAVVPFATESLHDPDPFEALFFYFLFTSTLLMPCWLLIALPLFIFLSSASDFWRFYISVPFRGIVGLIVSYAFAQICWSGADVVDRGSAIFTAVLSGTASGATMLGVMSWLTQRNRRHGEKVTRSNPTTEQSAK